jgi:hypothetical protein
MLPSNTNPSVKSEYLKSLCHRKTTGNDLSIHPTILIPTTHTFPQEERLIKNEYSINLPAHYNIKGKTRKSWINIINPFRALLVLGSPGSGKSYF